MGLRKGSWDSSDVSPHDKKESFLRMMVPAERDVEPVTSGMPADTAACHG